MPPASLSARLDLALLLAFAQLAALSPALCALDLGDDRAALLALDAATHNVLSTAAGWNGPAGSECSGSWRGVLCDTIAGQPRVTQLLLGQSQVHLNLTGQLPAAIGNLTALTQFELTDQGLDGDLPANLALLTNVTYLDFRHNRFTGGSSDASGLLPFMAMKGLRFLNLEGNSITGALPPEIGQLSALTNLELTGNALTGSIPATVGQLTHLQKLWLDANQLAGVIPPEIGNLGELVELRLGGNNLVGALPPTIGNLHSLTLLQVGLAHLSGTLPSSLADLGNLQELSLGTNRIEGDLNGVAWERLGQLQRVFLDNNSLQGTLPPALLRVAGLSSLRLQGNLVTGTVPRDVLAQGGLAEIDLRWNGLAADPDVAAFLDGASPGQFSRTQTLAPAGLGVASHDDQSVCLSWDAVPFQDVSGGYQVIYRRTDQPPEAAQTVTMAGKAVTFTVIAGLTSGTDYSFQIRSFSDPHAANQNTVTSDTSPNPPLTGRTASADQVGQVALQSATYAAAEGQILQVAVERKNGVKGPLSVTLGLKGSGDNPAVVGRDMKLLTPSVQWADQEGGIKEILIAMAADGGDNRTETAQLQLQTTPASLIGSPGAASLELLDRTVAGTVDSPVVATNGNGLELSVWTSVKAGSSNRSVVGRFTAGLTANVFPSQSAIADDAGIDQYDPEVLPLADTFFVLWSTDSSDHKRSIVYCEIDIKTLGCRGRAKAIVLDASATEFSAVADGDTFWLLWRASSSLHLAHFNHGGRVIGRRETVISDPSAAQPRLARLGDQGVLATWTALVPLDSGDPSTARPVLQGRSFAPATGFQSVLPDLAGPEAVEMRDFRLETRADGAALLSWVGVTIAASPSGPLRAGPQIHLRRVGILGTLEGGEVLLGCSSCGDLIEMHSIVAAPTGDCVATWVTTPADAASAPTVMRAQLRNCDTEQSETQLRLIGPAFRVHRVGMGSADGNLLVLGQRSSAPSLDLRTYRCDRGSRCRN
jgi:hypothetical protein